MKIKESELRERYKNEIGINYFDIPMKYMLWRKEELLKLMEENEEVQVIRDDAESYPDHLNSLGISPYRSIWV